MRGVRKYKRKSLYGLIVQSFIGLLSIVLLMVLILLCVNWFVSYEAVHMPKAYRIDEYSKQLKTEKYKEIPVCKIFGKHGYLEILDENAKVIYSSNPKKKTTYTKDSIQLISGINDSSGYGVQRIGTKYDVSNGGMLLMEYRWNKKTEREELVGLAVLDSKRNIKYSTLSLNRKKLTKKELQLVSHSDNWNNFRGIGISKYTFTTSAGEKRTALIHAETISSQSEKQSQMAFHISVLVFIITVILAIALTGFRLMKRLRTPLKEVQNAINEFGENADKVEIQSNEVIEFAQLISSFHRMERKLELEEAMRKNLEAQKHQMLAGISHDMKTPITVIRGYVDAIRDGLVSPEEQDQYLQIIEEKATDMANLINSLSEYNNVEHPNFAYDFQEGNLTEYLREYIASKYQELSLQGYIIEADIPEERIMASFDHKHLKRVWENIIGNSVKYTCAGSTLYVSLSRSDANDTAIIRIGDNGTGLPAHIKEHVFEPFVVAESARSNGQGTGLGLTVAKDIVEAHGGSIRIEDTPEQSGLFYHIELPIIPN